MGALLTALARDPARALRRWVLGGITLLGVAGLGGAAARAVSRAPDPCAGGAAKVGAVWDARRRTAIETAFAVAGLPYAKAAVAVTAGLDAYAKRWGGMYQDACLATRVRGEQSDELLDLRMACLSNRLQEMGAFAKVLEGADRHAIERAPARTENLPPLDDCANVALLRTEARLPSDVKARATLEEVRGALADARALEAAGRFKEGLAQTSQLVDRAIALRYRPLESEVLQTHGSLQNDLSDYAVAVPTLERAVRAATAGRSMRVAVEAQLKLAGITGFFQEQVKDGQRWADAAEASLEAEGDDPDLRIALLLVRANNAAKDNRYDEALGHNRDAVARTAKLHGETSLDYARAIGDLGNTLLQQGNFAEALAFEPRSLANNEEILWPSHPQCAFSWMNIGATLHEMQDDEAALEAHQRALAIDEGAYGHENLETARDLDNIGIVLNGAGKAARAEPILRDALAVKEKLLPPDDVELAFTLDVLGGTLRTLHRLTEARPMMQRALAIQLAASGEGSLDVADMERRAVRLCCWRSGTATRPERKRQQRLRSTRPSSEKTACPSRAVS